MPRQQQLINQVVDRVNDFNRRVRDLEEKIRNLNSRVGTLDDSLISKTKSLSNDIQQVEDELGEVRDRVANLEVDVKELNREKRNFVTEQELDEIEKYVELMNPLNSDFATTKEVKNMVGERQGVSKEEVERIVDRKMKNREKKVDDVER